MSLVARGQEINRNRSLMADICARKYWNRTGLMVTKGKLYSFEANGGWCDGSNPCNADGWTPDWNKLVLMLVEVSKRQSGQPLFKLIAAVNKNRPYIILGTKGSFVAPETGELYCFANDVPGFYGNNSGKLSLKIVPD